MADQMIALEATNVSKNFGGVKAVDSVNLKVPVGERRALIGPNGAGKTTFFNLITGELASDQGFISIFNQDITKKTVQERAKLGLGRTYQISQLFLDLTVEQNLFLAANANHGRDFDMLHFWRKSKTELDFVQEISEKVEVKDFLYKKVSDLSHGEQRQLEIGMAFAMKPRLIMLDEPAAGLSPSERVVLTNLIKKLPVDSTLIIIEHDMDIVLEIADQITVLNRGTVFAEGTPLEIRSNQQVQDVYLGSAYHESKS
jgi:branched-chain amino acid transport system ATP-binding protein